MASNDNAKTFSLLEQPCALRRQEEPKHRRKPGTAAGTAYDLTLPDSDYDAAQRASRRTPEGGSGRKRSRAQDAPAGETPPGEKGDKAGQRRRKG